MQLSDKEIERLEKICKGKTNREIQDIVGIYYKQRRKSVRDMYKRKEIKISNIVKKIVRGIK